MIGSDAAGVAGFADGRTALGCFALLAAGTLAGSLRFADGMFLFLVIKHHVNHLAQGALSISINFRHQDFIGDWQAHIVIIALSRWQHDRRVLDFMVVQLAQQMVDAIEPGLFLVIGLHHPPG
jgi:hypothetical protein